MQSLLDSKEALRAYSIDPNADVGEKLRLSELLEVGFWQRIEDLVEILSPISEAQKMSESNHAGVGYVYERWEGLRKTLWAMSNGINSHARDLQEYMRPNNVDGWKYRYNRQVRPIHVAAFVLDPANQGSIWDVPSAEEARLVKWLKAQGNEVYESYLDYSSSMGVFGATEDTTKAKVYWQTKVNDLPFYGVILTGSRRSTPLPSPRYTFDYSL